LNRDVVREILTRYKTVAVVGLSRDPLKDSYRVAEYLKRHGFHVIPVNPTAGEILGEKSYRNLLEVPTEVQRTVEIVDIFRPSAEVLPIVEQAIRMRKSYRVPYVVWMQLGIINEQAAEIARKEGLTVVMNKCMMQEHRRFFADDKWEKRKTERYRLL
jgi:predicted CoA-binding protein